MRKTTTRRGETSPNRGLTAVPRQTQKELIYKEVRHALQAGKFEPGEPITVKYLAAELRAGAMPIREALQRLAAEGALINLPTGRVRVPQFTAKEFDEIKEIRLRLEGLAAYQAATLMDRKALKRISSSYRKVIELVTSASKSTDIVDHNYRFHFEIYSVADNHHLISIIDGLWLRVSPLLSIPFKAPARARAEYVAAHSQNHARLIAALEARDGHAAESAVREIIMASADWYHRHHRFAAGNDPREPRP